MNISKNGMGTNNVQRYLCNNIDCSKKYFMLKYAYNGWKHGIEEQIIDMTVNASGIRDISRVLKVSPTKVLDTLKKLNHLLAL